MNLAIVVPCFNEVEVLPRTLIALRRASADLVSDDDISTGLIYFVDDGSSDGTWELISSFCEKHSDVRGIKLSRNVGHQNALLAGLMTAEGDAVVSIDADLQDDVAVIGDMVRSFQAGNDVVYGVRRDRSSDSLFKRFTADMYYRLLRSLGADIVAHHADFRLMSRRALDSLRDFREINLFLRGIIPLVGFHSDQVLYDRTERAAGVSKYPLARMIAFAADGITSFSVKPLRIISLAGILLAVGAVLVAIWALFIRVFTENTIPGWTSLLVPLSLMGGIQMLAIGAVGEYVGKIYQEVKDRPRYIIEKIL